MPTKEAPMKERLIALLANRKELTTIVGTVAALVAYAGFNLDQNLTLAILGITAVLVGAQGVEDHGATSAAIRADAGVTASPVTNNVTVGEVVANP